LYPNLISNYLNFFINILFLIFEIEVTLIILYSGKKILLNRLIFTLNSQYLKDFPVVSISTKGGNVSGKIDYIFDEDMIILDNMGTKIAIEWKEIVYMELR